MLKRSLKNTKLKSKVNAFFKKNKDQIIDIVLIGSILTGKETPKDIDILVIYKSKIDTDLGYSLRKSLECQSFKVEIVQKTYAQLFDSSFVARESFLSQGYSLVYDKYISQGLGYSNFHLFRYDLKGLNKSQRMRFYYSLYGRGKEKGMLDRLSSIKFSERVILAPLDQVEPMKNYLDSWKIGYLETPILMPERITKSERFKEGK